jgi:anaerobic selenocysteine-containing dehydrogenase
MSIDVGARIETAHTFCRLCEVMCGLEVTVTDGEITKVRADRDHPVSKGFACNKGLVALDVHRDPDRLDVPLRRTGSGWERVTWTDAVADVATGLRSVIDRHGPEAVAIYLGNPNAFNCLAGPAGALFLLSLGSTRIFSAATQDCANKFTISDILYGSPNLHPVADLAHTDHLLVLGSNPRISKSSFISVPDPIAALKGIVERGGAVTFVNPLRIEPDLGPTVQIRPDTDPYLLAAMLHHLDRTVGFDLGRAGDHVRRLDELRDWLAGYPPERVAPVVGIEAAEIERLATAFATAPTAAVHMSTGVNMGRQGALAYFLVQMLSLVTGNLDRRGGNVVVGRAIAPRPSDAPPGPESLEDTPFGPVRRSQGSLPAALLPEWIRHPETPIRALICVAGNPALSLAGATEVTEALGDLDLLVSIDLYRNATGELAHVNLPATDWFERPDLNTFTQGVQTTPHVQLTEAVVEPRGERKPEAEIFALLAEAMGFAAAFGPGTDAIALMHDGELAAHGLSVAELARRDRGLAVLDEDATDAFLGGRLQTPDGRIDCAPELVAGSMARADRIVDELAAEPPDQLRLITRRTRTTLNSALANVAKLKERGAGTNPLWMHPDDAAARGLAAGAVAYVRNDAGSLEAPVALDPDLRPGVVAMTHGFGYAASPGMPVAHAHPGVNVNLLSPSGPGTFDPLSGMSHLTGIPVEVTVGPATDTRGGSPGCS